MNAATKSRLTLPLATSAVSVAVSLALSACSYQPAPPASVDTAPAATVAEPAPASTTAAAGNRLAPSASVPAGPAQNQARPSAPAPSASASAPLDGGARPAPAGSAASAPAPPQPATVDVTIPAGTDVSIELLTSLSTESATTESAVRGRLRRAIVVADRTAIPAGATLSGVVTNVERPGKVKGRGLLSLRFTSVTVDGTRTAFPTNTITREGEADRKGDVTKVGGGAGAGAVIGGILGGGGGAAKGAAIGGAAGTAATLLTRGKDVELASGEVLNTSTSSTVTVELPR